MAKNTTGKGSPSRIRFVMVEAELGDGDIGQITQAIQNALRGPQTVTVRRIAAPSSSNGQVTPELADEPEIEDVEEQEDSVEASSSAKPRGPRKPAPTPNVIDIDMNTAPTLASFASGKDAKSQHKKFLIAAAWLKEHRNIDAVTPDHIYTCFRFVGWSVNIPDFGQPLRDLKRKKYFTQNDAGAYSINHLGLDYVNKLGGKNGAA